MSVSETGARVPPGGATAERVQAVRRLLLEACELSGRDPASVTLIGASKSQPVDRLREAWQAGIRIFGENRVQEALAKMSALPPETEWHLIGPLQSNKVKKAVGRFRAVHSVDRLKIARALETEALRRETRLQGFLEVNLGREESKHGFLPDHLIQEVRPLADLEALEIVGLMAVPPFESEPEAARHWFRELRRLREELCSRPEWSGCPGWLSMGMSHDFEIAIEEGATHVRVGSALFGPRPE
ncbi:MAG: YggS family pyridoxal phosphate-dependent enzyme [Thermoanaerobaculia bacterium]